MKLNKIELKKVMYDFNSISNRLIRVNYSEYNNVLNKFIAYLDNEEIIKDYILDCGFPSYDIKTEVEKVATSYSDVIFDLGNTTKEEVSNIFHILKYINENNIDITDDIARCYSWSGNFQDMVKEFNERVVMVLIRHIEDYLTKIGIDMGIDEKTKYSITVNNGQVNLASDNSTINANQLNNGIDLQILKALVNNVKNEMSCNEEDAQIINDSIEVIETELAQPTPKKNLLRIALSGIKTIKGTAEFGAAILALYQFVQSTI